jgi:type IV pilus assembly protein PilM
VITKVIPMPADLDEDDLESQVELEAVNYVPYPIEEVNLDFEVLGPMPNNPGTLQVLLAASRSENVELRSSALEIGGLTPRSWTSRHSPIENAFALLANQLSGPRDGLTALIDSGATMTTLNVLRNGRSLYSREQVFGGQAAHRRSHAPVWPELRRSRAGQASGWLAGKLPGRSARAVQGSHGPAGQPPAAVLLCRQ